ncbi:MAG: translation elongation factor 4 [Patescibacteria group bacterium]|nr:translation elongation factor 4 [Patescibacteria group bacterium]
MSRQNIRNFCIIAHIDHGKSTLADRFLELTGTVEERKMKKQVLDQMDLERERGITIKLQPARMKYKLTENRKLKVESKNKTLNSELYTLNLIDTPGHVDFSYEVSRSLAAVEGAILLVDATQGIQAQTLANLYLALEQDLVIIPVINKIDMPNAMPEEVAKEISELIGVEEKEIIKISAKTGENVETVLREVVEKIPAPQGNSEKPARALIFDSYFDSYKGAVAQVRIVDGKISKGDKIYFLGEKIDSEIIELGIMKPELVKTEFLEAGDIGYIATGLKEVSKCRVGDTVTKAVSSKYQVSSDSDIYNVKNIEPLPGYQEVKPVVFASMYPVEGDDYPELRDALEKLKLNDASLSFEPESSSALGRGFRCGFLGMLHLEIVSERLSREYNMNLVITTPSVSYQVLKRNGKEITIFSPADLPDPSEIEEIREPWVKLEVVLPKDKIGAIMKLAENSRAIYKSADYLSQDRTILAYEAPLINIIVDFYDNLKSVSSGFASLNYELIGFRKEDLIKVDILVGGERVEAFSKIVPRSESYEDGKRIVEKLKDAIPRQNFAVALQAAISGKIIARETIRPFRKDVTAKLYGGDVSRKRKLLEKQKKGKKKMKSFGKVDIPQEAFLSVLKKK